MNILIRNGLIVTMNPKREVFHGDVLIEGNRIREVAPKIEPKSRPIEIYEAAGQIVIPGLIQAHTHLVQTLFRGEADDLSLLDWLKKRVWPMEAAHDEASIRASAEFGVLEMMKLGTTSILDMGTVRHTDPLFDAVQKTGIRYWGGKCLMDAKPRSGPLWEPTKDAIRETEQLIKAWHRKTDLLHYAICPRFAVSCTKELLEMAVQMQKSHDCLIHTHASESLDEIKLVKKLTGRSNVDYLDRVGVLNSRSVIVHGVHLTKKEIGLMKKTRAGLTHCPSSNLKLGSGIAPIQAYKKAGLKKIGLGADGAPCNNIMDPFKEMHLAALLQKPFFGPRALPAREALELATLGGARVLGMEKELGSLEPGKLADLVLVERTHPSAITVSDPYSALVYSCSGRDVKNVIVNGRWLVRDRHFKFLDEEQIISRALEQKKALLARA